MILLKYTREIIQTKQRFFSENDKETLTGDREADKRDNIDSVDNKKSDKIYQIQKTSE